MKNLLMFLMAISLLTACDNNPLVSKDRKTNAREKDDKKEKKDKDDTEDADDEYDDKDDKKVNEDDGVEDDYTTKDDDDETTGGGWTRPQRKRYVNECINEAKKNISLTLATSYCDCMQYKIEKKYKMSFDEANRITIEDLSTPEAKADIQQCLGKN